MKLFDPNNPNEKKKMIAAGVLGLIAIVVLGFVFFGGSSKPPTNNVIGTRPSPSPRIGSNPQPVTSESPEDPSIYQPISYNGTVPAVSEADRNIFAYYEAPSPTPKPVYIPTPSPTPTPPMMASGLWPSNVYARTADCSLQLTGDKFT